MYLISENAVVKVYTYTTDAVVELGCEFSKNKEEMQRNFPFWSNQIGLTSKFKFDQLKRWFFLKLSFLYEEQACCHA